MAFSNAEGDVALHLCFCSYKFRLEFSGNGIGGFNVEGAASSSFTVNRDVAFDRRLSLRLDLTTNTDVALVIEGDTGSAWLAWTCRRSGLHRCPGDDRGIRRESGASSNIGGASNPAPGVERGTCSDAHRGHRLDELLSAPLLHVIELELPDGTSVGDFKALSRHSLDSDLVLYVGIRR